MLSAESVLKCILVQKALDRRYKTKFLEVTKQSVILSIVNITTIVTRIIQYSSLQQQRLTSSDPALSYLTAAAEQKR